MGSLVLVKPLAAVVATASQPRVLRLLTPDPKEACLFENNGTGYSLMLDYGAAVQADTAYLGYHTAAAGQSWRVYATDQTYTNVVSEIETANTPLVPLGLGFPYHQFKRVAVPVSSRYWRVDFGLGPSNTSFTAGIFALGLAFQATWGVEMGAGRNVIDTGTAERLFGGGFAIDEGTRAAGFQWTFGDLQALEIRQLYQIVKDVGVTKTVLVVEDPDRTDGLNERVHWGLFSKLDFYERRDPANWKWSLQMSDWA